MQPLEHVIAFQAVSCPAGGKRQRFTLTLLSIFHVFQLPACPRIARIDVDAQFQRLPP